MKLAFPALKLPILVEEGDDAFQEPESKKKDAIMFIINPDMNQINPTPKDIITFKDPMGRSLPSMMPEIVMGR
ncbi:MAG: hypothetical protein EOP84_25480 [Verrucomicrobiaceae bacterium]|nr:MAG: hypothetical protein EOP84_25480 [Verrucomicrobiaceae bacterium]